MVIVCPAVGESDGLIYCDWGRKTSAGLLIRDINVIFYTYPNVDHEIVPEEVRYLAVFPVNEGGRVVGLNWLRFLL